MNTTVGIQCRRCGASLSGGVPGGLCAACFGGGLFAGEPEGLPFTRIGDYELLEEIGRGGMGLVYRARQISLNRPAAVKLILTGPLASAVERQRFVAEASAAAALDHAGIVPVFEAGEEDGQPFFAMQLIEGESLSARLSKGPRFKLREAAELMRRTALAIQHAHERGFLHRDLKPGNILLDDKGAPHVTDFGLARRVDDESHLTLTGAAVGTPSYMAPEQTDTRRPPTTAVDVYSLGAILYEVLSGRPPFAEKSLPELFVAIREKEPASISSVRSEVDRDLDIICRKCLEKEPARRYRTALALADDLQHWLHGEPISARPVGKAERFRRWCRRRPAVAGLAAAVVVLFFTGLAGVIWQWDRANREARAAREALQRSGESLWRSYVSEARARRVSRERGQRMEALRSLTAAAAHRPAAELRNEAIAALALPDLGEPGWFCELPEGSRHLVSDPQTRRTVYQSPDGTPVFRGADAGAEHRLGELRWHAHAHDDRLTQFLVVGEGAGPGHRAELWSLPEGMTPVKLRSYDGVTVGAFSPDGSKLVLCRDAGVLEVHDPAAGTLLTKGDCPLAAVLLRVSPDGSQAVLVPPGPGTAELWSLNPPARLRGLPAMPGIFTISWHPQDGSLLICSGNRVHHVRPALSRADELASHEREGAVAEGHPSGLFGLSSSWDGVVRVTAWGLRGDLLRTAGFRPSGFSADGRLLAVVSGRRVGVCETVPLDVWRPMPARADEDASVYALEFSPDSRSLAVVSRESAAIFDPESLAMKGRVPLEKGSGACWTAEGELLVCEEGAGVSRIQFTTEEAGRFMVERKAVLSLKPQGVKLESLRLSPNGKTLVVAAPGTAAVYDLEKRALRSLLNEQPMLSGVAWSPDGRWIATGYWNNIKSGGAEATVFNAEDGSVVQRFPAGSCRPAFTPDGSRLIIGSTHEYVEYEIGSWRELRRHPREASGLDQGLLACCAASNLLVIQASESVLRLLRLDTGEELARLEPPSAQKLAHLAISPDGHWLACEAQKIVRLWDLHRMRRKLREMGLDWED